MAQLTGERHRPMGVYLTTTLERTLPGLQPAGFQPELKTGAEKPVSGKFKLSRTPPFVPVPVRESNNVALWQSYLVSDHSSKVNAHSATPCKKPPCQNCFPVCTSTPLCQRLLQVLKTFSIAMNAKTPPGGPLPALRPDPPPSTARRGSGSCCASLAPRPYSKVTMIFPSVRADDCFIASRTSENAKWEVIILRAGTRPVANIRKI